MQLLTAGSIEVSGLEALSQLYAPPDVATSPTWVRANFVATLDGAAAGADGLSGSINGEADQEVFGVLRALADVVLVGAGTVAAEGYRPIQLTEGQRRLRAAAGRSAAPVLAVVGRSPRLTDRLLARRPDAGSLVFVCTTDADPAAMAEVTARFGSDAVLAAGSGRVDLAAALDALAERGLTQVLCEGGPTLLSDLVQSGRLDELCLTWSPLLVGGSGPQILAGGPVPDGLQAMRLVHLLEQDSVLIGRWVSRARDPGTA